MPMIMVVVMMVVVLVVTAFLLGLVKHPCGFIFGY